MKIAQETQPFLWDDAGKSQIGLYLIKISKLQDSTNAFLGFVSSGFNFVQKDDDKRPRCTSKVWNLIKCAKNAPKAYFLQIWSPLYWLFFLNIFAQDICSLAGDPSWL